MALFVKCADCERAVILEFGFLSARCRVVRWRWREPACWLGSFHARPVPGPESTGPWLRQTVIEGRRPAAFAARRASRETGVPRCTTRPRNSSVPWRRPVNESGSRPKPVLVMCWLVPGAVTSILSLALRCWWSMVGYFMLVVSWLFRMKCQKRSARASESLNGTQGNSP